MNTIKQLQVALAVSHSNVAFFEEQIKKLEEEAKKITVDDIILGKKLVSKSQYLSGITILPYGWQFTDKPQLYSMGGRDGNPFMPYSTMQGVTAERLAHYLNMLGYIKP